MDKRIIFAILAWISVIINSFDVCLALSQKYEIKDDEGLKNNAAKQAKSIVYEIQNYANNLSNTLSYDDKLALIKKEINKINFNKYQEKAYAFDSLGFYIAHYSKDYENQNILLEKDITNNLYIKELVGKINDEGYTNASIFWTNHSIRHIITYIKKDKNLNVYYGCTIDLDLAKISKSNKNKNIVYEKSLIIFSSVFVIILIIIFTYFHIKKGKKYEKNSNPNNT